MTADATQDTQSTEADDKTLNFRALEAKYQKQLSQRDVQLEQMQREVNDMREKMTQKQEPEEDDDDTPYIDKKKFKKTLTTFEKQLESRFEKKAEQKAYEIVEKERQSQWLKTNADFYDVMKHAEKLAAKDPDLAETILEMPDNFERQKLVYRNIKTLGLHKPPEDKPKIQDKIDNNQKGVYYQPSGMGNAPYASGGDYSKTGQKAAYEQMQALKARLR